MSVCETIAYLLGLGQDGVTLAWQDDSNLPTPGIEYYVNGVLTNFFTTDYPDTSGEPATLQNTLTVTNLTATAEAIDWSWKYLETDQ
jgi:hypothetical protein